MTGFLIDTVTVSELRKQRPDPAVMRWFAANADRAIYLSCVTYGEIERGIGRARQSDPLFAARLEAWLAALIEDFGDDALPLTTSVARRWGRLSFDVKRSDLDLQIAATALVHDLTVVTRNVRHFEPAGVRVVNPWEG
ncbi:MAG: type II toxin-antitoxin system VapC family toxin [Janthinobacterium lividum]